jgi:hypothetical protein
MPRHTFAFLNNKPLEREQHVMKHFILITMMTFCFGACGDGTNTLAENGAACVENGDCQTDDCRQEVTGYHIFFGPTTIELTDGMCTTDCTWLDEGTDEEMLRADCADGEQCLAPVGDASATACFQGCETQEDCREDWVCTALSGFSTCLPPPDSSTREIQTDLTKPLLSNPAMVNSL